MSEKQIEETEKPFILVIGFFFHITIAFCEGWLAPRDLIYNINVSRYGKLHVLQVLQVQNAPRHNYFHAHP